jgi:uncharacterized protein YbjT (DUF2867 family)
MILVAGATGKVASEVVKFLRKAHASFKAASKDLERARKTLGEDVPLVLLNYSDAETFAPALQGIEHLFLFHPQDRPNRVPELKAFIDTAKAAGVKQAVFMSALGANRHENDGMNLLEKHLSDSGIETTVLRPNWFMQNFNSQDLQSIKERDEIILPSGDHKLTFIDTRDIAEVAAKILVEGGHGGKAYTLMGGEALNYPEVAAMLSDLLGRPIKHNSPSPEDEIAKMRERGFPAEMIDFMEWLYADITSGYTAQFTSDVETVLGRPPRKFSVYLKDYAESWK